MASKFASSALEVQTLSGFTTVTTPSDITSGCVYKTGVEIAKNNIQELISHDHRAIAVTA